MQSACWVYNLLESKNRVYKGLGRQRNVLVRGSLERGHPRITVHVKLASSSAPAAGDDASHWPDLGVHTHTPHCSVYCVLWQLNTHTYCIYSHVHTHTGISCITVP